MLHSRVPPLLVVLAEVLRVEGVRVRIEVRVRMKTRHVDANLTI